MHFIKDFGIQVIQDVNNSVMHTLLSGTMQCAEIRGCMTFMGHEKRQDLRKIFVLSAQKLGVQVHLWYPQFLWRCVTVL